MKEGIVVFLDILGFKGIWNREIPALVINKLGKLSKKVEKLAKKAGPEHEKKINQSDNIAPRSRISCFADTTLIVCWNNSAPEKEFWRLKGLTECFRIATSMASAFIIEANDTEPYFIFRGCVSVGDFFLSSDGRFFLGPAVDDAADMERRANGAFVFLSPSALSFLDRCSNYHFDKATGALIDYYVPLKNNSKLETKIVRPISFNISDNEIETVCKRFLNIFPQDDSDSLTKRKNTENMLRAILESDKTHITYDPFNY